MNPKRIIFILSCWRSGTSWLEDILGKNVPNATLFGHEQQLLPTLAMFKQCWSSCPMSARRAANMPICDIDNFHEQLGLKLHKILANTNKFGNIDFNNFAMGFVESLLAAYTQFDQVVCKSPENLSSDSFNLALELFQNNDRYGLVYLYRSFKPYLASCFAKFGVNTYYCDKYLAWHTNAVSVIRKLDNLYVLNYDNLVADPSIVAKFSMHSKPAPNIRAGVLDKWKQSPHLVLINQLYADNEPQILEIEKAWSQWGSDYSG